MLHTSHKQKLDPTMTSRHEFSPPEKMLVVKVRDYLRKKLGRRGPLTKLQVHREVAACLEIAPNTVAKIVDDWDAHNDPLFTEVGGILLFFVCNISYSKTSNILSFL